MHEPNMECLTDALNDKNAFLLVNCIINWCIACTISYIVERKYSTFY